MDAALALGDDVLAVAWDMPFVTEPLLATIRDFVAGGSARATVPESDSPHAMEPFCALYRRELAGALETFLRSGGGPARDFLATQAVARIPLTTVATFGDPRTLLFSVNSAADLARARALCHPPQ